MNRSTFFSLHLRFKTLRFICTLCCYLHRNMNNNNHSKSYKNQCNGKCHWPLITIYWNDFSSKFMRFSRIHKKKCHWIELKNVNIKKDPIFYGSDVHTFSANWFTTHFIFRRKFMNISKFYTTHPVQRHYFHSNILVKWNISNNLKLRYCQKLLYKLLELCFVICWFNDFFSFL